MSVRDIIQAAAGVGGAPPPPANAWDLDFASFQGIVRSGVVADGAPTDVKFNADGTLMYVLGTGADSVLRYILTTPYQPSTAIASFTTGEGDVRGIEFKPDGTKMYVIGISSDAVFEYNLSVAWDVFSSSFVQSKSVSAQTGTLPLKVRFKDDGTKMYVLSDTNDSVYQYSLSVAWDISTATYDAISYNVSAEVTGPQGMFFGDSGSLMYITGSTNAIYGYTLTTPWDLSTVTKQFNVNVFLSGNILAQDIEYGDSDSKVFYLNNSGGTWEGRSIGSAAVIENYLSTPQNISTATYQSFSPTNVPSRGIFFESDGLTMYSQAAGIVRKYSLSTAWDISTVSEVSSVTISGTTSTDTTGLYFKSDGTVMYVGRLANDTIYQFNLSVAWDITTASYSGLSFSIATQSADFSSFTIGDDGNKLYASETGPTSTPKLVLEYNLTVQWDISSASYTGLSRNFHVDNDLGWNYFAFSFKPDGTKVYIGQAITREYTLTTAWNISTATYSGNEIAVAAFFGRGNTNSADSPYLTALFIGDNGRYAYFSGRVGAITVENGQYSRITQARLSTDWDISTLAPGFCVKNQEANPTGVAFKSDGTKMYVIGTANKTVYQYSLSTAWEAWTATYDSVSFSVATEEATPQGLSFKTDGTKMYVIGSTGDDVNEYSLSVAWDITTASYTQNFSVAAQTGALPGKVKFKSDGTKMYVSSQTNPEVYEYSLSTAWDISTASYNLNKFELVNSVSIQATATSTTGNGFGLSSDGAKMISLQPSSTNLYINEYTLNSAWNISTPQQNLKIPGTSTTRFDLIFSNDGLNYYISNFGASVNQRVINQFSGSDAWNIGASLFVRRTPDVSVVAYALAIKSDGSVLYGGSGSVVTPYKLAQPYNLTGASIGMYVGFEELTPNGVAFKDDGTKMYVVGTTNDTVYQYTLSTAWDVFTASYEGISFSVAGQELTPQGITFKTDGTKMYIIGSTGDDINEYTLNTAWNVSTASFVQVFSVSSQTGAIPQKVEFSSDGTTMFVLSETNNAVYQYNLSSAWNISTASYASVSYPVGTVTGRTGTTGLAFADSGTKMYTVETLTDIVWGFVLGTAWSLATTNAYLRSVGVEDTNAIAPTFKPDGTEMYIIGTTGDDVNQYSVSTAWQVDKASFVRSRLVSAQTGGTPVKVQFKDDGTKMYVLSNNNDAIYQYSLSTAWDISTATYDTVSFSVTSQEATPTGMFFGDSGTKLYVVGNTSDTVFQYNLSVAWDLSTASYSNLSKSVAAQDNSPQAVFIGNSGSTMYIAGITSDTVYQYTLSTPWDVSTATYANKSFSVSAYETVPQGLWFKDDGLNFYVLGPDFDIVWQFTIS